MDGLLAVKEAKLALGLDALPDEAGYHTLAGFLLARLGRVPAERQAVTCGGYVFEVVDMNGRRIDKVLVRRAAAAEEGAPDGAP
jgi:putative hemolysin